MASPSLLTEPLELLNICDILLTEMKARAEHPAKGQYHTIFLTHDLFRCDSDSHDQIVEDP